MNFYFKLLPFVDQFICERVSRSTLHDIRLCLLVCQGYGGDLSAVKQTHVKMNKKINKTKQEFCLVSLFQWGTKKENDEFEESKKRKIKTH